MELSNIEWHFIVSFLFFVSIGGIAGIFFSDIGEERTQ